MSERLIETLRERGWNNEDIEYVVGFINEKKAQDRMRTQLSSDVLVYWIALLITIVVNIVLSLFLIPFIIFIDTWQIYVIIGSLAIAFGFFFNLLISDIDSLDSTHHIVAGVFIPGIALVTIFLMMRVAITVERLLEIDVVSSSSPLLVGGFYVLCFMLPYGYSQYKINSKAKSKSTVLPPQGSQQQPL